MRAILPFAGFLPARTPRLNPLRFKGQLIDEMGEKDRELMGKIDTFACSQHLNSYQRQTYEEYLGQYSDLNDDLQQGMDKKAIVGLMKSRAAGMWKTFTSQDTQQSTTSKSQRKYSSSRLSQSQSSQPETIKEEE